MEHEHWTLDEELLAAYTLGRLPESEREKLARHLDACTECRKRAEEELVLAAGVQRAGRNDLKARLRQRLDEQRAHDVARGKAAAGQRAASYGPPAGGEKQAEPGLPASSRRRGRGWVFALATAACIVIVTGVGILNRWWSHDTIRTVSLEEERAVTTPPATGEDKSSRESYAVRADEGTAVTSRTLPAPAPGERPSVSTEETMPPAPTRKKDVDRQKAEEGVDAYRSGTADQRGDAGRLREVDRHKEAKQPGTQAVLSPAAIAGAGLADEGTWVEGETAYIRMDKGANVARSEAENALRSLTEKDGTAQQAVTRLKARIEQRPLADAPVTRRQQQRRQQSQAVLANIQQTDSTLRLTLYPDPQLNERDLRQAQVYRVTPDTIIVVLPGQMIRYRVGFQAAMPAK